MVAPSAEQLRQLEITGKNMGKVQVGKVARLGSGGADATVLRQDHTALSALQFFTLGTHRCVVVDSNDKLVISLGASYLCWLADRVLIEWIFARAKYECSNSGVSHLSINHRSPFS